MNIREKLKSVWTKGRERFGKKDTTACGNGCCGKGCGCENGERDAELGADEVIREEVFPDGNRSYDCKHGCGCNSTGSAENTEHRTRPTNGNYRMIDPSDDTCDAGKS